MDRRTIRERILLELRLLRATATSPSYARLLIVAAAAQAVSLVLERSTALPSICGRWGLVDEIASIPDRLAYVHAVWSPWQVGLSWLVMTIGMMLPLLAVPIEHVWESSLPERRQRAVLVFLASYFSIWMAAGPLVLMLGLILRSSGDAGFGLALGAALLWASSPAQQMVQNRAHRLRGIGIFGRQAYFDCLAFGAEQGRWCVAACWAWMVLPLAAGDAHALVAACVTLVILRERIRGARAPHWRVPAALGIGKFPTMWKSPAIRRGHPG